MMIHSSAFSFLAFSFSLSLSGTCYSLSDVHVRTQRSLITTRTASSYFVLPFFFLKINPRVFPFFFFFFFISLFPHLSFSCQDIQQHHNHRAFRKMNQIASTPVAISYNHEPRSGSMSSVLSADTTSTSNSDSVPSDSALSASSLDMLDRYSFTMHHYHDALLKMSKEKKAGPKDGPAKA